MGSSLIDVFIDKLRIIALQKLTMGYLATNIDLGYLSNLLAFDDAAQCEKFLLDQGMSIITSLTFSRLPIHQLGQQAPGLQGESDATQESPSEGPQMQEMSELPYRVMTE
jgi:hypothetical protein